MAATAGEDHLLTAEDGILLAIERRVLGLERGVSGQLLLPIGTLYDPFICRGLDAFICSVYSGAC